MSTARETPDRTPQPRVRAPLLAGLVRDLDRVLPHRGIRAEESWEGDRWVVRAQLPGLDARSVIDLTLEDGVLVLDVALHPTASSSGPRLHQLHQVLSVPAGTALSDVVSTYDDGVLTVSMPASPAARRGPGARPPAPVAARDTAPRGAYDGRVVVGVDGSRAGAAALRWALPLVAQEHCVLEVVVAWTDPADASPEHDHVDREHAERVAEAAKALARRELPDDVAVTTSVVRGDPGDVLVGRARNARFLVLGSPRALGAGVPRSCQGRVTCPVFVVLPGDPR